jgi:hypothetical protein
MVHRLLPPIIAIAVLSLFVSHHPARAGKAWCLSDPVIELNGQVIDVRAYAYVNDNQIDDSEYVFTVAPGSTLRVLDPGPDEAIAVYVVPGQADAVTYRVINSPTVNLKLTVTTHTAGAATSAEVQSFGRAIAVSWPSTGGTVASSPTTVETSSLTPVPTATSTPTAMTEPTVEPTSPATATSEPASTTTTEPTLEPTSPATATSEPTQEPTATATATSEPMATSTPAI